MESWRSLTGPSGWFELWHPPGWQVDERDGAHSLIPSGGDARVCLNSLWHEGPVRPAIDSLQSLPIAFPDFRNLRSVAEPGMPDCLIALVGESDVSRPPRGLRRIIHRSEWRPCRVWVLQHETVVLVVHLTHGADEDPELVTLCRLLLQSIQFAESPAVPPKMFVDRVLELAARRYPLLKCRRSDDLQIIVGDSTVNLFNFYRTYIRAPERFEEIVLPALTTVVQVQGWGDAQTRPPLERVRDRIMPMLYPEAVWQDRFAGFVGSSWVAGLAVLYVVDEANAYWYIPHQLLSDWQLTEQELHALSLENLERYFEQHPMELAAAGNDPETPSLLMPARSDAYNAARIISHQFTARLRESVGGDLAVGVPGRDFFVAVSLKSPEMLEHVRGRVQEDFATMDHPLTDRLLLLTADGASELCDPEAN